MLPCNAIDIIRDTADMLSTRPAERERSAKLEEAADCLETLAEQLDKLEDDRYEMAGILEEMARLLEGLETVCRSARFACSGDGGVPKLEVSRG